MDKVKHILNVRTFITLYLFFYTKGFEITYLGQKTGKKIKGLELCGICLVADAPYKWFCIYI